MKSSIYAVWVIMLTMLIGCTGDQAAGDLSSDQLAIASSAEQQFQNGDIIFQSSQSKQCEAVKLATHSAFSHCGVIFYKGEEPMVFEAVQPVKITPLNVWISCGENEAFVVRRLIDADVRLTAEVQQRMRKVGLYHMGKDYDPYFEWSDERIYCSELVWKIYAEGAGIELSEPAPLSSFDLSSQLVKQVMHERYGDQIPANEPMVSPGALHDSPLLITVATQGL